MRNLMKYCALIMVLAFTSIIPYPANANSIIIKADNDWFGKPSWLDYTATVDGNVYSITNNDEDAGYSFRFNTTNGVFNSD